MLFTYNNLRNNFRAAVNMCNDIFNPPAITLTAGTAASELLAALVYYSYWRSLLELTICAMESSIYLQEHDLLDKSIDGILVDINNLKIPEVLLCNLLQDMLLSGSNSMAPEIQAAANDVNQQAAHNQAQNRAALRNAKMR